MPDELFLGATVGSGDAIFLDPFAGAFWDKYDHDNITRTGTVLGPLKAISTARGALRKYLLKTWWSTAKIGGKFGTATELGGSETRTKLALISHCELAMVHAGVNKRAAHGESVEELRNILAAASLPESAAPAEDVSVVLDDLGDLMKVSLSSAAFEHKRCVFIDGSRSMVQSWYGAVVVWCSRSMVQS